MINDRLIDPDSLVIQPGRVSLDVRIPWYRAVPASCIHDVTVHVDGRPVPADSMRFELNGRERRLAEFPELVDESWFTTDSLRVTGDLEVAPADDHDVLVNLKLYIPYIVTAHGVLMIDESLETKMAGATR
ncbi:DUF6379 domain-containing protein [Nocardioides sp. LS1]|uniref:C-glycoside deglycosidase beta subunit domain-containing protein n=1 Tax=Nocardioides sp. LS1 TaxID=1027620 RepID=UPI000F62673D|nr:DUF6379 domain-containing protein [Nocardioides sp. LS1]GCD89965.1 hypothetical protein NLS1_19710 [Nocardioides sp. LS1]